MSLGIVKKGSRYFYNPANSAVYPWSSDLAACAGLMPFTAPEDGEFHMGMTLAQAQEAAEADVAAKEEAATRGKEEAAAKAEEEGRNTPAPPAEFGSFLPREKSLFGDGIPAPTLSVLDYLSE